MQSVKVGRIGKPFGVKGEMYVHPDADLGEVIVKGVQLTTDDGRQVEVTKTHWHGDRFLIALKNCDSRDDAELFRGQFLHLDRDEIELEEDTTWVHDLLDVQVVDTQNNPLGVISGVRDGTAHDWLILRLDDSGKEVLIPHVEEIINIGTKPFVLDPPEGLLELG